MKKRYFYFALAAMSAPFALLSACGEGFPISLEDSTEMGKITEAMADVADVRIPGCLGGAVTENCPEIVKQANPIPSSSSFNLDEQEPEPSSSSSEVPSSSSEAPSSSSEVPSSSSEVPSSSSEVPSSSSEAPSSSSEAPSSSSEAPSSSSVVPSSSSEAPSSSSVTPSGNLGGSTSNPIIVNGNGDLPNSSDLASLGGVIYLSGSGRKNSTKIECGSGMSVVDQIKTCDFRDGDCTPSDVCGGPFNNPNGNCNFPNTYYVEPSGTNCYNVDCPYNVKIQFILKSGQTTYPSDCKKAS